ncbi:metal ABC transporter ATP-binding protein [Haloplasma contractile]|uniref:ABC transporter related protein n=1 Tax=Haloplasma contractile SSD-17B TaxID=1033810 RepID=U2DUJ4_9MOLU|nr:ABC transporter ATP-binding protein [Haloplasma contractile]ERJ12072.1 ABC transporter related protein [Haloplasma contractile SSD-17B]
MKNNVLNIEHLTIKYGKHTVLKDLTFKVQTGDYVGIIGPNGSGKSTLVRGILGLVPITNGQIEKVTNDDIGYLPQKTYSNDQVFPATVKEIVLTGLLRNKRFPNFYTPSDHKKVDQILKRLQIIDLKENKIGTLSGGQQQRVMLARAVVSSPKILILDEPTSALDPKFRETFYKLVNDLNKNEGITILHISHDLNSVMQYMNRVLHLDRDILFYGAKEKYLKLDNKKIAKKQQPEREVEVVS